MTDTPLTSVELDEMAKRLNSIFMQTKTMFAYHPIACVSFVQMFEASRTGDHEEARRIFDHLQRTTKGV